MMISDDPDLLKLIPALRQAISDQVPFTQRALLNALFNLSAYFALQFGLDRKAFEESVVEAYDNIKKLHHSPSA